LRRFRQQILNRPAVPAPGEQIVSDIAVIARRIRLEAIRNGAPPMQADGAQAATYHCWHQETSMQKPFAAHVIVALFPQEALAAQHRDRILGCPVWKVTLESHGPRFFERSPPRSVWGHSDGKMAAWPRA
jgi:hypothetical protein